jgi:hypothetical protein
MDLYRPRAVARLFLTTVLLVGSPLWGATLQGTVRIKPPYPSERLVTVDQKHQGHCGEAVVSGKLSVSPSGGVANVVISLMGEFPKTVQSIAPAASYVIHQKECQFLPHILLVPRNHPFLITNEDPMAHDVRAFEGSRLLFWHQMEIGQEPIEERLDGSKPVVLRCGLHKWMHAFVIPMEHPHYALTNQEGEYQLADLPQGNFRVQFWHEVLGEESREVLLEDQISHVLDLEFPS